MPKEKCEFEEFFAHRFVLMANGEYVPISTLTSIGIENRHELSYIVEHLPKDHKYQTENMPLTFILKTNEATLEEYEYVWKFGDITVTAQDLDNNGVFDRMRITNGEFNYEDLAGDGLSEGDLHYYQESPKPIPFSMIIGSPIADGFYVSGKPAERLIKKVRAALKED